MVDESDLCTRFVVVFQKGKVVCRHEVTVTRKDLILGNVSL